MPFTILVPLDGSELAERALPYAERLARARAGHMLLVRAAELFLPTGEECVEAEHPFVADGRAYLHAIAEKLRGAGVPVETVVPYGRPVDEIVALIGSRHADLVVMASHGRSGLGRWLYGSVADALMRQSPAPIVLVPPDTVSPTGITWPTRILVPLDGSGSAELALGPAMALAAQVGSELVLVQVVPWPPYVIPDAAGIVTLEPEELLATAQSYLQDVAQRLKDCHAPTKPSVRCKAVLRRSVATSIADLAEQESADLIAMTTHGRGGLQRLVLGSVATGTLRSTATPLLLVRPTMAGIGTERPAAAGQLTWTGESVRPLPPRLVGSLTGSQGDVPLAPATQARFDNHDLEDGRPMRTVQPREGSESEPQVLSEAECLRILEHHKFGRIAVVVQGQPRIFPVNYASLHSVISIRTAAGTKLAFAPGTQVGFEVDGFDATSGTGWSVMVQGVAVDATTALDDVSWTARGTIVRPAAPGPKPFRLAIQIGSVSGRRFTAGDRVDMAD